MSNKFENLRGVLRSCVSAGVLMASASGFVACAQASDGGAQVASATSESEVGGNLEGVWSNTSLTTLERGRQYKSLVLSRDEADAIKARAEQRRLAGRQRTDPNSGAPPKGRGVGGYNNVYIDAGAQLAEINGEIRTSWLVEPADGRLPYSEEGRKIFQDDLSRRRTTFDGPEIRPLGERCVVGYGSSGGPPMINVLYNNNYQIVQTDDHVMILVEMNHDARIIRLNSEHLPEPVRPWLGDSIGWWDGETLVVETTQMHPQESLRTNTNQTFYISQDATITERFTRLNEDELFYEFSVDDPTIFSQTWRAEMIFNRLDGQVYEYACHEGNYSLPGILAGAREDERRGLTTELDSLGE